MISNFFPFVKHFKLGGNEKTPQSKLQKSAIFLLRLSDVFYLSITKVQRKDSLFTGTYADLTDLMQKSTCLCVQHTHTVYV